MDLQEAIKLNQCQGIYIESVDVSGAWDNAIDMVAVQWGHVINSAIHFAGWCIYTKGGSAYFVVSGNEIYDCGESGFSAGQGTGMRASCRAAQPSPTQPRPVAGRVRTAGYGGRL